MSLSCFSKREGRLPLHTKRCRSCCCYHKATEPTKEPATQAGAPLRLWRPYSPPSPFLLSLLPIHQVGARRKRPKESRISGRLASQGACWSPTQGEVPLSKGELGGPTSDQAHLPACLPACLQNILPPSWDSSPACWVLRDRTGGEGDRARRGGGPQLSRTAHLSCRKQRTRLAQTLTEWGPGGGSGGRGKGRKGCCPPVGQMWA